MLKQVGLGLVCAMLAGCGAESDPELDKLVPVSGKVTLDGKPLPRGTVVFHADNAAQGYAEIRSDGSYRVKTGDQRGLMPGTYRVTITAYKTLPSTAADDPEEPVPDLLTPPRYNKPDTSGLVAEVQPGSNSFDFSLTR